MAKPNKQILTAAGLLIFFVIFLLIFEPQITGMFYNKAAVETNIIDLLSRRQISDLTQDIDGCIIVSDSVGGGEPVSFKIKEENNTRIVEESSYYCEGSDVNDIVLSFFSLDSLVKARTDSLCNFFEKGSAQTYYFMPSKYILSGGNAVCNEEFQEKYCPLIAYCIKDARLIGSLSCCRRTNLNPLIVQKIEELEKIMPREAKPKNLSPVFIIIILILVLGTVGFLVMNSKGKKGKGKKSGEAKESEEQKTPTSEIGETQEIDAYIRNVLSQGYTPEQVYETLIQNGWPADVIEQKIRNALG